MDKNVEIFVGETLKAASMDAAPDVFWQGLKLEILVEEGSMAETLA